MFFSLHLAASLDLFKLKIPLRSSFPYRGDLTKVAAIQTQQMQQKQHKMKVLQHNIEQKHYWDSEKNVRVSFSVFLKMLLNSGLDISMFKMIIFI